MKKVITRFAPSPTGFLHIGNARIAIINWLYARKCEGEFILRIDDTDITRSIQKYKDAIITDLTWLGINWDRTFCQSSRLSNYLIGKERLLSTGRLYPCYETPEELALKRKLQLSRGFPPIYDRASLRLTKNQISSYEKEGRKPHYRFMIQESKIEWLDMIKGTITYKGANLSDPIIVRADGSMTYMLCSTIDDIKYKISHIIRGEDHITNTAIQIQIFQAFLAKVPVFGHLSLVKAQNGKISKRESKGFEIINLRSNQAIEPMAINTFAALIGSSNKMEPHYKLESLLSKFNISSYSRSPTTYLPEELAILNHKLIIQSKYEDIKDRLSQLNIDYIDEKFWMAVRQNLHKITDVKYWWKTFIEPVHVQIKDLTVLIIAVDTLPENIDENTWAHWTKLISKKSKKKGRDLFMPLRLALTGVDSGPELKNLLPLLSREEILRRLKINIYSSSSYLQ